MAHFSVCRLDHAGRMDDRQATALLRDEIQKQDFAKRVPLRASRILWPVSGYRTAPIMPQLSRASRASRPGRTVGFLRILRNGLCTAQRFHVEGDEQMCRVGCPDETDSLSHYNECPLLYNFFASVWRQATLLPRRSHLLHDLITQVFLRSLQYGIVVMAFADAFVHGHHQHRRSIENPGNIDCMKGRIRFMTAITSTYAHAIPGNMSNKTRACGPLSELSPAKCRSQVSASPQRSFLNARKRQ